jgi:isopenicillin-N epimerase
MKEHEWEKVAANCRQLVKENAPAFCALLNTRPLAPLEDDYIQQLFAAEIKTTEPEKLHALFFEKYKIQIPVMPHSNKVYLRYSINAFNSQQDLDILFAAISDIKKTSTLIEL